MDDKKVYKAKNKGRVMKIAEKYLLILGFSGQFFFSLRFVVQWISTEKHKKSIVPPHFWYFSIVGGILLLIYAILKKDIVFTVGQACGLIVYLRNLYFIKKAKKA